MDNKENTFRPFTLIAKALVALVLFLLTIRLFTVQTQGEIYFGVLLLVFFTLPTVFIVFFKNMVLGRYPGFKKFWKILRMIYVIILALFVMFLMISIYRWYGRNQTANAVALINSQKITLDDVMGKNLPPAPDQKLNDSTIAGIDVNKNGIRDDVELAIFKEYPNSARIRAAELQYAQEIENELTNVSNTETWMAMAKKENNGSSCLADLSFGKYTDSSNQIYKFEDWEKEVRNLVFNTDARKQKMAEVNKYETTVAIGDGYCDIQLSSLPN